jgi:putative transposase
VFDYIEMFYNLKRRHGYDDRVLPVDYEKQYFERLASARTLGAIQ